jgi:hypothetical protein
MEQTNLKELTVKELNTLQDFHHKEDVKQKSINANVRVRAKAEIIKNIIKNVDLGKLNKEYKKEGILKTYLETGVISGDEKSMLNNMDILQIAKFYAKEMNDKTKLMSVINYYHKRIAMDNEFNPWKHIYEVFEEEVDEKMSKGDCFSNIICMLEISNPKAKEISETYNKMKHFHSSMVNKIEEEIKTRKVEL